MFRIAATHCLPGGYATMEGSVIADLGTNPTKQQYKFGGKELITANGLNEYDFGARQYYPAVPAFTRIDPMCEDTRHLSPYIYCANNPVNFMDANGNPVYRPIYDYSKHLMLQNQLKLNMLSK